MSTPGRDLAHLDVGSSLEKLTGRGLALGRGRVAVRSVEGEMTYDDLARSVDDVAKGLRASGFLPGHRVAIILPPSPAFLSYLLGAVRCGLTVTPLSVALGKAARRYRLAQFAPDLVVDSVGALEQLSPQRLAPPRGPEGRVVLWTSGSSALPKGVVFSPEALLWNAITNAEALGLMPTDQALVLLDTAYCYALVHQIFSHLASGATILLPRPGSWLGNVVTDLERWRVTSLAVVPAMLSPLLGAPSLSRRLVALRLLTVGGASAPEALLERTAEALPGIDLRITYGLTEAGPRVSTRRYEASTGSAPGGVGKPLPGVVVTTAEDGELLVSSPSVCSGYLSDGVVVSREGQLKTGDLGEIAVDGSIRFLGRKTPVINRAGVKISPAEIERVLCSHHRVAAARVTAIPHPRLGEVPKAIVVSTPGEPLSAVELIRYCSIELGPAAAPATLEFVPELPSEPLRWKEATP